MLSPLPVPALFTYGLLTAAIIGLWIRPPVDQRLRPAFWNICLLFSVGYGLFTGLLEPVAPVFIIAFGLFVHTAEKAPLPVSLRLSSALLVIGLALVLMLHRAPGFIAIEVIDGVAISPDAVPYTKALTFDKPMIGLLILALGHRRLSTPAQWGRMLKKAGPCIPVVPVILLPLSLALGYVRLDVKWPSFWWFWIWTNLIFTCIAEEALFRGFIQRHLERLFNRCAGGPRMALGLAAVFFGLIHFAGGVKYVVLATVAGVCYGFVYQRTQSIEASILTHFALNFVHFVFFTYPALLSAVA